MSENNDLIRALRGHRLRLRARLLRGSWMSRRAWWPRTTARRCAEAAELPGVARATGASAYIAGPPASFRSATSAAQGSSEALRQRGLTAAGRNDRRGRLHLRVRRSPCAEKLLRAVAAPDRDLREQRRDGGRRLPGRAATWACRSRGTCPSSASTTARSRLACCRSLTTVRLPIRDIGRLAAAQADHPGPCGRGAGVGLPDRAAPGGARLLSAAGRG